MAWLLTQVRWSSDAQVLRWLTAAGKSHPAGSHQATGATGVLPQRACGSNLLLIHIALAKHSCPAKTGSQEGEKFLESKT